MQKVVIADFNSTADIDFCLPAEVVQAGNVAELSWSSVRLLGIPLNPAGSSVLCNVKTGTAHPETVRTNCCN